MTRSIYQSIKQQGNQMKENSIDVDRNQTISVHLKNEYKKVKKYY
ncbi:unnamed protein product [Paramecium octaurelia]|uniref:Uncharacterized protein n=1 Tax=Paramecium octaurelia TaxID=43137 RepID=A0A8S1W130_PAROT|nr:unnamed protein product [Paramecium octaurelia]